MPRPGSSNTSKKGIDLKRIPMWGWGVAIAVGLVVGLVLLKRAKANAQSQSATAATPSTAPLAASTGAPSSNAAPADNLSLDVLAALGVSRDQLIGTLSNDLAGIAIGAQQQLGYISAAALGESAQIAQASFAFGAATSEASFAFGAAQSAQAFGFATEALKSGIQAPPRVVFQPVNVPYPVAGPAAPAPSGGGPAGGAATATGAAPMITQDPWTNQQIQSQIDAGTYTNTEQQLTGSAGDQNTIPGPGGHFV